MVRIRMNRTGTGSRVAGKWWLPESTIADAVSGIMENDGQFRHIFLSDLFNGSTTGINTLIGILGGNPQKFLFHVLLHKFSMRGSANSGVSANVDYLVTDYEPITKNEVVS